MTTTRPLVSVLVPVLNGARYLETALDSVLAQTHEHWELVVVDNASTDATPEMVRRYARRDGRIRTVRNPQTVGVIDNHNVAFAHVAPGAAYVKVLHADDWLFPECLDRMVRLAEAHPSVGLVSAYALVNGWVDLDGLPYPSTVVPGRELAALSLMGGPYVFGSPSSVLFRADLVRKRTPFFDPSTIHADEAACYDLLTESDFGFVHQVLTGTRKHRATVSASFADRVNSYLAGSLRSLVRFGPEVLPEQAYRQRLRERLDDYYRFLARRCVIAPSRELWRYHVAELREAGHPLSRRRLAGALLGEACRALATPRRLLHRLLPRSRARADAGWPLLDEARRQWQRKDAEQKAAARVKPGIRA